ncbi:MAG: hypothetical protein Q9207_005972 [Kuettlingeria erythrocarpa]
MGRSKTTASEGSLSVEIRQRVTKACQRCRLKKCKCDGHSPCSRCRSDDAICAYVKHQQFDKIVYRKGYVQMLERQQAQLIAGIQKFHSMTQKGDPLPTDPLESNGRGQPLVHQILQRLGVLQASDPWDEVDAEEAGSESPPSTELDSATSTNFDIKHQILWPGDTVLHASAEASLASAHAWTTSSAADATLLPWTTASCQFLDGQRSAAKAPASWVAGGFVSGPSPQRSYIGGSASGQSSTGAPLPLDAGYLPTYSDQFLSSASGQFAPPPLNWPVMWDGALGMTGEGSEQHRHV